MCVHRKTRPNSVNHGQHAEAVSQALYVTGHPAGLMFEKQ